MKKANSSPSPSSLDILSEEDKKQLIEEEIRPFLRDLLRHEVQVALGTDQAATISRGRIFDRFFGKPTERKETESTQSVVFMIKQKEEQEGAERTLTPSISVSVANDKLPDALPPPSPETPSYTEGSFTIKGIDEPAAEVLL